MKKSEALGYIYTGSKRFLPGIVLRSLISCASAAALLSFAFFSGNIIDISTGQKDGGLTANILLLFGAVAVYVGLVGLNTHLAARIEGKLKMSLQRQLFSSFSAKRFRETSQYHTGDVLNRMTDDVDAVASGVSSIIPSLCSFIAKIAAGIAALFLLKPAFAVICIFGGLLIPWAGRLISSKYKYLHKEVQRTGGVIRSFLQECFANMTVVKSFSSAAPLENKLDGCLEDNFAVKIRRNLLNVFTSMGLYSAFTVGYYIVLVWGASSIAGGGMTYGALTAVLQIMTQLRAPLQNISGILPQYYAMTASAERLMELEDLEDEEPPLDGQALGRLKEDFRFIAAEHLSFDYGGAQVVRDATFVVERGDTVAITGPSGVGKTTLFRLLLGLNEPDSGDLSFNGREKITAAHRRMFAYVPQGNMILSGTIRENITLGCGQISEEALTAAAKAAEIYDFILSLPDGFDTVLAERGAGLSEGQIQRIAIARALVTDAPVLLLDECSSALDEATERAVLRNLGAMKDRTVLFITHREAALSVCSKRLTVEDGIYRIELFENSSQMS